MPREQMDTMNADLLRRHLENMDTDKEKIVEERMLKHSIALRKLLEAKDAAVRAVVHPGG